MKLLVFSSPSCAPCGPTKEAARTADIGCPLVIVDVEETPQLTQQYQVRQLPTLIVVDDDGAVLAQHPGMLGRRGVEDLVRRAQA